MIIHVVRPNETLEIIAAQYDVSPILLAADNDVPQDGALAIGQTLCIRIPVNTHTVGEGETLTSIGRQYNQTARQIYQNNRILGGRPEVFPGQTLVISYEDEPQSSSVANGYAYPFTDRTQLDGDVPYLSHLTPFTYGIDSEGNLLDLDDEDLLAAADRYGTISVMHLSTLTELGRFDTTRATTLLTDIDRQVRLLNQIQTTMLSKGYSGIDVDFEFLPGQLALAYAAFLTRLRERFAPQGWFVWAALAPKTSADQPGLLYEGHNYEAVSEAVDAVLLMTYEWGYTYGPPMAVAPIPNVRRVLDYAQTAIPMEKAMLGLPNYGYDWPLPYEQGVTMARSISNQEAIDLAIQYDIAILYDEQAQAPYFNYTDRMGTVHEVWFEDARSLAAKLSLVTEYGMMGTGIWNITRPFAQTYVSLVSRFQI